MGAFKKYVRPEGGGGRGLTKSEQKRTGGGGLSPLRTFAFQKIVWPILFTLAIVIELFSSLLNFFFLLVSSCFFCLVVSFCIYVYLSTFVGGRGGCQNKKISVRTRGGGGVVQKRTRGGGGSKIAKFERTYFLNAPNDKQVFNFVLNQLFIIILVPI